MFTWIRKFYIVFLLTAVWILSVGNPVTLTFDFDDIQIYDKSGTSSTAAVQRAADYLWKMIHAHNWNSLSPRVVVALAFAQRAGIPRQGLSWLKKEVGIHIKMALVKRNERPSLFDLAQYINALYATCQDPRHFHGMDLVRLLRTEANAAKELDQPFVLLTLCIANEIDRQDFRKLWSMYNNVRDDTLGSKALIVMAMVCISNAQRLDDVRVLSDFKRSTVVRLLSSFDVYTKILHVQALNALRYKPDVNLVIHQDLDGSFGDVLATYYAIPALLNTSLLDLKCKSSNYVEFPLQTESVVKDSRLSIVYSLWIQKDTFLEAHSMPISLEGNKTFYDLMKKAEAKNSFFRFLYDVTSDGKKVYSIADIPNDVEMGKVWTLYRGRENRVKFNSKHYLMQVNQGVDRIYPAAGEHFVFWYEHSST